MIFIPFVHFSLFAECFVMSEHYFYNKKHYFGKWYSKKKYSQAGSFFWCFKDAFSIFWDLFPFTVICFLLSRMFVFYFENIPPSFSFPLSLPMIFLMYDIFQSSILSQKGENIKHIHYIGNEGRKVYCAFKPHWFNFNVLWIKRFLNGMTMTFSVENLTIPKLIKHRFFIMDTEPYLDHWAKFPLSWEQEEWLYAALWALCPFLILLIRNTPGLPIYPQ